MLLLTFIVKKSLSTSVYLVKAKVPKSNSLPYRETGNGSGDGGMPGERRIQRRALGFIRSGAVASRPFARRMETNDNIFFCLQRRLK